MLRKTLVADYQDKIEAVNPVGNYQRQLITILEDIVIDHKEGYIGGWQEAALIRLIMEKLK